MRSQRRTRGQQLSRDAVTASRVAEVAVSTKPKKIPTTTVLKVRRRPAFPSTTATTSVSAGARISHAGPAESAPRTGAAAHRTSRVVAAPKLAKPPAPRVAAAAIWDAAAAGDVLLNEPQGESSRTAATEPPTVSQAQSGEISHSTSRISRNEAADAVDMVADLNELSDDTVPDHPSRPPIA